MDLLQKPAAYQHKIIEDDKDADGGEVDATITDHDDLPHDNGEH